MQEVFGSGADQNFACYKFETSGRPPSDKIPRISFTSMRIEEFKDVKRPNVK